MEQETVAITARRKLQIYELTNLLAKLVLEGRIPRDEFLAAAKGLVRRFVPDALPESKAGQEPTHDLASSRRVAVEARYRSLGFANVAVPKPNVSNREYTRRQKRGQELFYRPSTAKVSYEAWMKANGQNDHWTVTDKNERAKIGWEPAPTGYWFWAEVQERCPRTGTSRNDLTDKIRLLSLEEYTIVWHLIKAEKEIVFDRSTYAWLRTSYSGSGALEALECNGRVYVHRYRAECLADAYSNEGGRLAEVVKG